MKKTAFLMTLFGALQARSAHADVVDKVSLGLVISAETLLAVDFFQTVDIQRHAGSFYEVNPILGKHPSDGVIVANFAVVMTGTFLAWYYLPSPWRELAMVAVIGVEAWGVTKNATNGIGFSVPF